VSGRHLKAKHPTKKSRIGGKTEGKMQTNSKLGPYEIQAYGKLEGWEKFYRETTNSTNAKGGFGLRSTIKGRKRQR